MHRNAHGSRTLWISVELDVSCALLDLHSVVVRVLVDQRRACQNRVRQREIWSVVHVPRVDVTKVEIVRIIRWCFPSMDVLTVYTDSEFDVCGICVCLSTFWESLLGQNK